MCETWVEERGWNKIKGSLPVSHEWACSFARRDLKRGRARGGFIIGKRKGWGAAEDILLQEREEGVVFSCVQRRGGGKKLIIVSIYNNKEWAKVKAAIKGMVEEFKNEHVVIGGDFNARIWVEGGNDIEGWDIKRRSKDCECKG